MNFSYGEKQIMHLKQKDKALSEAIDKIGFVECVIDPDLFSAAVNSIIGQQLSMAAQKTIWNRLKQKVGVVSANNVALLPIEEMRSIGLSKNKACYILGLAEEVLSEELDIKKLQTLPDDEVIKRLTSIKGIGVWTAEMLLLFSMQRPNVLSFGDLAIHRGLRMLYHHRNVDKKLFEKYRRRYSPYCSVASLYLWEIAGGAISGMKDYATKGKK